MVKRTGQQTDGTVGRLRKLKESIAEGANTMTQYEELSLSFLATDALRAKAVEDLNRHIEFQGATTGGEVDEKGQAAPEECR